MYNCTSACNYIQAAVQVRGGFKCTIVKQPVTMYRMLYRRGEGVTVQLYSSL